MKTLEQTIVTRDYSKREKDRLDLIDEMAEKAMNDVSVKTLTEMYYDHQYCYFESMSQEDLISTAKQMGMFIEETLQ
jgi:predicted metallo-beta-lactamase superfamily hydrolase